MLYKPLPVSHRRFSFIPHDLIYFNHHFICLPMAESWQLPPVTPHGRSYKAADFVLWMLRVPVISANARAALARPCAGLVEFLPFHAIRGKPYWAVNVLSRSGRDMIHKAGEDLDLMVTESFGEIVRDARLSGLALTDASTNVGRRVIWDDDYNDFPGLVG